MTYAPPAASLWDPWFLRRADGLHLFHLRAPRATDPDARHHDRVCIGHALEPADSGGWERPAVVLEPGPPGTWDDLALWTGCCVEHGGEVHLFYTARSRADFWRQRIGVARSADPGREPFVKDSAVVIDADEDRFERPRQPDSAGVPPAWRDPFVFRDPGTGGWLMAVSARRRGAPSRHNGALALLRSPDLRRWEPAGRPLLAPDRHDEMEVPQVVRHEGRWYAFFGAWERGYAPHWRARWGAADGLHCYVADDLGGPWHPVNGSGRVAGACGTGVMGLRLLGPAGGGRFRALGWVDRCAGGRTLCVSAPAWVELDGERVVCHARR